MNFPPVEEQLDLLLRGAVDVLVADELRDKLTAARAAGRPLRVKAGFDPTAPDLHIGHTVLLTKLRQFQDLGHTVIFLIGDFTAMIGDPTGRSATRKALTRAEVVANAETYKAQVFKVLDAERTEVRFNSEWLDQLGSVGTIELAAKYTVARMMEREDFRTRFQSGQAISVHEFLYPLMQGYDSVALEADVEVGGTDQLFNLLMGRHLQGQYGQPPQSVLTMPLLEGTDGRLVDGVITGKKMSKSLGNYVGIAEAPLEMFGKLMSITDDLMWRYADLLSTRSTAALKAEREQIELRGTNPRDFKIALAKEIIGHYHGAAAADGAAEEWLRIFSQREVPSELPEFGLEAGDSDGIAVVSVLKDAALVASGGEARRMLKQGAVTVDGERVDEPDFVIVRGGPYVIKVGKKRFAQVTIL
ncbi:MAG: tyrosine--tRNA ligase [Deltaproteobacteria bacterium HGW-Deltaproteobacteria-14]|jgi:tyrosyl-tRNA synthetase|nr:MAG: tyrosine--tRNA ligase [Deltaproteobacteria bacterium HGW-Deltaproteobacteria-14]